MKGITFQSLVDYFKDYILDYYDEFDTIVIDEIVNNFDGSKQLRQFLTDYLDDECIDYTDIKAINVEWVMDQLLFDEKLKIDFVNAMQKDVIKG